MNIEQRKKKLIKKNGTKPTVTFYYYCYKVVDYAGEKRVRKSFESIADQGEEVVVSDYGYDKKTEDLCKEYGITYIWCEKDENVGFNESKVRNNVIRHCKTNFIVDLNINVEYPKNTITFIRRIIKQLNHAKERVILRYKWIGETTIYTNVNKIRKIKSSTNRNFYGFAQILYVPFLINMRGYDERTHFCAQSQKYGMEIFQKVWKIKHTARNDLNLVHKYHNDFKLDTVQKINRNTTIDYKYGNVVKKLRKAFQKNFKNGRKLVQNSFW